MSAAEQNWIRRYDACMTQQTQRTDAARFDKRPGILGSLHEVFAVDGYLRERVEAATQYTRGTQHSIISD